MKIDTSKIDYAAFDRPEISRYLFYPRPEYASSSEGGDYESVLIPVERDVVVGARFHVSGSDAPSILFFHGNGEIVADYDDIAVLYREMGINFLPVDYRGYGRSTGRPTVSAMIKDCHAIYDYVKGRFSDQGHKGSLIVMGRSLGCVSALEIAFHYGDGIDGLIIESGFAEAEPLLELMGLSLEYLGITEDDGFRNSDKIRRFGKPTLIIHAQHDHLIPFEQGRMLFEASPAGTKRLLTVAGAGHNDLFYRGMDDYLKAVKWLVDEARAVYSPEK